ncbi:MAG TPA: LppP/LprE family lipoprotein [Steroidobacteraceae bacterium]|nr:LppP/LprE family lipoprotein [Steroidobacteraceae bacterium]
MRAADTIRAHRRVRIACAFSAVMVIIPAIGGSQAPGASWLDQAKPRSWNEPAQEIPAAPGQEHAADPRCRALTRPAEIEEDKRLQERGWDLVGDFRGGWQVRIIIGTAGYDGMCRPRQYQGFVFVHGVFAGTLSPDVMDSRTDGALDQVHLDGDGRLTAEYRRYAASDPLCCPSRTTSVVFDIANGTPVLRPVSASTSHH